MCMWHDPDLIKGLDDHYVKNLLRENQLHKLEKKISKICLNYLVKIRKHKNDIEYMN